MSQFDQEPQGGYGASDAPFGEPGSDPTLDVTGEESQAFGPGESERGPGADVPQGGYGASDDSAEDEAAGTDQDGTSYASEGGEPTYGGEPSGEPRSAEDTEYRTDGAVESGATGEQY